MLTEIKTISRQDLNKRRNQSDVQILNVLEPDKYYLGMIPGSLRIPNSQLENRVEELDRTKQVVTYCANSSCPASREAAERLALHRFEVFVYEGGIEDWNNAGLPVET